MLESITLADIVYLELIGALVLLSGILWYVLYRERRAHKELRAHYDRMCNTIRVDPSRYRGSTEQDAPYSVTDAVAEHLYQCEQEAKRRYRAITQTRLPRLSADAPFTAKIAALRFLYTHAESEAYRNTRSARDPWVALERHLYDITRWIVAAPEAKVDETLQKRVKLLQKRIETLKPYEQRTRALKRSLQLARLKHERLQELQEQDQRTIKKLEQINRSLKHPQEVGPTPQLWQTHETSEKPEQASNLRRMAEISAHYQTLGRELREGLRRLYGENLPEQQDLQTLAERLATDLEQSRTYIERLKQEMAQGPTQPGGQARAPLQSSAAVPVEGVEGPLMFYGDSADKQKQLAEAGRLQEVNRRQDRLMRELERQLEALSDSAESAPDEVPESQRSETQGLKETLQECRECISALEGEIALLTQRLQDGQDQAEPVAETPPDPATEEVNQKLRETLLNSRFDTVAKQFALDLRHTQSLDEVTDCLISATKSAGLVTGFFLQSALGNAEFYRSNQYSERDRQMIKTQPMTSFISNLQDGVYFTGDHIRLLWKQVPADAQARSRSQRFLENLIHLCSDRIRFLELDGNLKRQRQALGSWSEQMRGRLVGLKVRRAYQAEETLRQCKHFASQQQRLAHKLGLSDQARASINKAIDEYQSKIDQAVNGDGSLEAHFGQLLEQLDALPR